MDNNNTTLLVAALAAGAGFYFWQQSQEQKNTPSNNPTSDYIQTIGVAPPVNTPEWATWVGLAINLYGTVSDLWQPGGPFHNEGVSVNDVELIYDDVNTSNGGTPYNPNLDPNNGSTINNGSGSGWTRLQV